MSNETMPAATVGPGLSPRVGVAPWTVGSEGGPVVTAGRESSPGMMEACCRLRVERLAMDGFCISMFTKRGQEMPAGTDEWNSGGGQERAR